MEGVSSVAVASIIHKSMPLFALLGYYVAAAIVGQPHLWSVGTAADGICHLTVFNIFLQCGVLNDSISLMWLCGCVLS